MDSFYSTESLEDCATLSFKFNVGEDDDAADMVAGLKLYVADHCSSLYYVAGRHDQGKNEVPHIHANFIVKDLIVNDTNESRQRRKWGKAMGFSLPKGVSMRDSVIADFDSAQKVLAYPLKEGKLVSSEGIKKPLLDFLQSYGVQEFEAKKQRDLAKVRASEKTENLQSQILALIPNALHFTDYGSYKRYIYTKFYEKLKINEYPQRRSVESAIQNIAIYLKIVEPYYFDKF